MDAKLIFVCWFLFFNYCAVAQNVSDNVESTKKLDSLIKTVKVNQSELFSSDHVESSTDVTSVGQAGQSGRTFGRPFKKMVGALMPLIFQLGAASTWAVVAALVGVKTLAVTLIILKLLLVAGAAKIGALFASKTHSHHQEWSPPPQKEIHLHIHNQPGHEHHEHHDEQVPFSSWNREGITAQSTQSTNFVLNPYQGGPQTISTPFGNYVKID